MTRPRMPRGDDGAYAILYGLLLLVVLGTASIVVDLAAMREDRRSSRLAADAAVVSGARFLDPLTTVDPEQACIEALGYVQTNLGLGTPFPTAPCTTVFGGLTCESSELTATSTSGGVTVTVTWPVMQDSDLLLNPDVQGDEGAQVIDTDVDGAADTACQRLGVTVSQIHEQFLAGIFGASDTATTVSSVARSAVVPGGPQALAALNVLNETTCNAVRTSGSGFIQVNGVTDDAGKEYPGIISVESSGRDTGGGDCPNNRRWVLNAADNASGAYVRADEPGAGGEGQGVILMFALNASPTGNPDDAYDPSLVPPNTLLRPKPTKLTFRSGESPVRNVYDCTAPCDDYPESYVDLLKSKMQTGAPQAYPYAESPYNGLAFKTLTATDAPGFSCKVGPKDAVLVPVGNWYVDCDTLTVQGTMAFSGGTIVTKGGISVQGCLAVNVPLPGPSATCPTVVSGDTSPVAVKGAILYLRSGSFDKGSDGHVLMPRTFVYMNSGALDFVGGPSGLVFWTNPLQSDVLCQTDLCKAQRFSKMTLWNESSSTQSMGGQSSLTVRGVVFLPSAKFTYTGAATQNQTNAQFWADTIEVGGQSGLIMAPDPESAIPTPLLGVVLIR